MRAHVLRLSRVFIPAVVITNMAQATQVNDDRSVRLDLPELTDNHEIMLRVGDETWSGPVTRIDTYGDTTDVERVVQFNPSFKHQIPGPDWEPWKVYLVEEPAGVYRANLVLFNGEISRSRNLDQPDEIDVARS